MFISFPRQQVQKTVTFLAHLPLAVQLYTTAVLTLTKSRAARVKTFPTPLFSFLEFVSIPLLVLGTSSGSCWNSFSFVSLFRSQARRAFAPAAAATTATGCGGCGWQFLSDRRNPSCAHPTPSAAAIVFQQLSRRARRGGRGGRCRGGGIADG